MAKLTEGSSIGIKSLRELLIKQHCVYDGNALLIAVYEGPTDMEHADACVRTRYVYNDAGQIVSMHEDNSTWNSAWDVQPTDAIDLGVIQMSAVKFTKDLIFNGSDTTMTIAIPVVVVATTAVWVLKDLANDSLQVFVEISTPDDVTVVINTDYPLPAGTYRLIGMG